MPTIPELNQITKASAGDQLAIWDDANKLTRRITVAYLFASGFSPDTVPENVLLIYPTRISTTGVAFKDGQRIEIEADETWDGRRTRNVAQSGSLVFEDFAPDAIRLQSYTAMRSYAGKANAVDITAPGVAGRFNRDDLDIESEDNGGTVIVGGNGVRWKRVYSVPMNVMWFEAIGDGVADDTNSIKATHLAANGRKIYAPAGRYRITSPIGGAGSIPINLFGDGIGETVFVQDANSRVVDIRGDDDGPPLAITSDAVTESLVLMLSSTESLASGDYLYIKSNLAWPNSVSGGVYGEIVRIQTVDSPIQVTIEGPLDETYLTADSPTATKLSLVGGSSISGITIENSAQNTRTSEALLFQKVKNLRIDDVETLRLDGTGIRVRWCIDWIIDKCQFIDSTNDIANNRYGYGVNAGAFSRDGLVRDCRMRNGRHLFTTGTDSGLAGPRHILVEGCVASEQSSAGFDTHEDGRFITFSDCYAHNLTASGFNFRCQDIAVYGCRVVNIKGNASALRIDTGAIRCNVNGFRAQKIRRGSSVSPAIVVNDSGCILSGIYVEDADGEGIRIEPNANRCTVFDSVFKQFGAFSSSVRYAISVRGTTSGHEFLGLCVEHTLSTARAVKMVANVTNVLIDSLRTIGPVQALEYDSAYPPLPVDFSGLGTPEAVITAPIGSTFKRSNGGAGSSFYVKEIGTGNTGWVSK